MIILDHSQNFSVSQIASSGQCFRMKAIKENTWSLIAKHRYVELTQSEDKIVFKCSKREFDEIWKDYFDLETDYASYIAQIDPDDAFLKRCVAAKPGIRILRQDLTEIAVTSIITQNNNIPRIKKSIEILSETLGKKHVTRLGVEWHDFPEISQLTSLSALEPAHLGYRAEYVARFAQQIVSGELDLELLGRDNSSDNDLLKALTSIYGIGPKVASCIMLFGYHRLNAVPVDTWIKKIIHNYYEDKNPFARYQGFAGLIQQYMFDLVTSKS